MTTALVVLVSVVVLAACEGTGGPRAAPSAPTVPPNFPFPSGGIVPIPTTESQLRSGGAHIDVRGDTTATLDLPLGSPTFFEGGIIALVWRDDGGNLFTLAGIASGNQVSTSITLLLTISLAKTGETFVSTSGRCTITFDALETTNVRGTFTCPALTSGQAKVSARGSFTANA